MSIEVAESQSCPGYVDGPPWLFKGSALYQLHLVKADIARSFIPKDLRLVEAFGYTLGGFFLARYDDSPAGMFDELVVIAGIVWNPPTSCAWAARVLVNSHKACRHGRKHVGLPSHVARFSKSCSKQRVMATSENPKSKWNGFLNMIGISSTCSSPKGCMDIQVTEITGSSATALCDINLPTDDLFCRVRAVEPAKISGPTTALQSDEGRSFDEPSFNSNDDLRDVFAENDSLNRSISVLLSKPIFALEFNSLKMQVDAPTIVSQRSDNVVSDS
ncbi:protein NEOXANTHIN-DEFICIENT 1 isoform X5 [Magnolia sinica]|uniref:protein NEOXANTHIN-DEFICIENT 1 isoform X5 n=1 Tax=Magnolia sinica TaxID=86752 RepID=UPI00265904DA|nr:protein NEOXANTHIN-DEFICIENT 1 isoform X5 [Magnolia sinica]